MTDRMTPASASGLVEMAERLRSIAGPTFWQKRPSRNACPGHSCGPEAADAIERLIEALTPSGETKYAYSGEFSWTEWLADEHGIEQGHERTVPWTTIKEIMAAIRARAIAEQERGE